MGVVRSEAPATSVPVCRQPAFFSLVLGRVWALETARARRTSPPRAVRAMGGIGDLLTMTPGLRALSQTSGQRVQFAVPARFAALFAQNDQVEIHSLEELGAEWLLDGTIVDLTDCPAAKGESAVVPDVRKNRIELFASGMGINRRYLERFGTQPFYEPSPDEWLAAENWLRERGLCQREFVAVQAEPAEAYKRYDRMPEVARALATKHPLVAIHDRDVIGYDAPNVYCAFDVPLGVGLAIACQAKLIISADSAFVHFAGARDIPCIAIYGPTDGRLATKFYPRAIVVDQRSDFACMPCWRNENIPCVATGGMRSACLDTLSVESILKTAEAAMPGRTGPALANATRLEPRSDEASVTEDARVDEA
jgi:ADP-heptose:LPS heptosyltransferase